ncbi:hypothetical protein ERJ75_000174100 [Trypanosoma vivax]|nr:hypothetical protein ERJ75_000174100 [Trypanosoma vivax]
MWQDARVELSWAEGSVQCLRDAARRCGQNEEQRKALQRSENAVKAAGSLSTQLALKIRSIKACAATLTTQLAATESRIDGMVEMFTSYSWKSASTKTRNNYCVAKDSDNAGKTMLHTESNRAGFADFKAFHNLANEGTSGTPRRVWRDLDTQYTGQAQQTLLDASGGAIGGSSQDSSAGCQFLTSGET